MSMADIGINIQAGIVALNILVESIDISTSHLNTAHPKMSFNLHKPYSTIGLLV